jgi:hypothetical protein
MPHCRGLLSDREFIVLKRKQCWDVKPQCRGLLSGRIFLVLKAKECCDVNPHCRGLTVRQTIRSVKGKAVSGCYTTHGSASAVLWLSHEMNSFRSFVFCYIERFILYPVGLGDYFCFPQDWETYFVSCWIEIYFVSPRIGRFILYVAESRALFCTLSNWETCFASCRVKELFCVLSVRHIFGVF